MKKTVLIGICSFLLTSGTYAQNFTTQNGDTVKVAIGSDSTEIQNRIQSIVITPVKITWKVTATDMTGDWAEEGIVGICDNDSCHINDKNNNLLKGAEHLSGDYPPGVPEDFYLKLNNLSTVSPGTKYITINLTDGTQTMDITFVITRWPAGITSVSKLEDDIFIYPNPAGKEVNVLFDAKRKVQNITVYNLIGKAVKTYRVHDDNSARLNLSDIAGGVYLVKLHNADGQVVATRRLVHQ